MPPLKHHNIDLKQSKNNDKLTAVEMGKLWAIYMGNSMSKCILSYYLQHVDDEDIKQLLEKSLGLSIEFINSIKEIFESDNVPIPVGFNESDVNLGAPRLFADEFYVHYLKYTAKAGMSIFNVAIPLVYREDVRDFFIHCMKSTLILMEEIKEILMNKGLIIKPPIIPAPEKVNFVNNHFLNGYIGDVRPLHALEITHLYDNIENNATSNALVTGFHQVVKNEKIKDLFLKGKDITHSAVEHYTKKLNHANLPSPSFLSHLITTSTFSPFSDKLMLYHKVDMFSMKMRAFGNSVAVNGRHDIGIMYTKALMGVSLFVEDGAKILIENGWMEQPPEAVDRDNLASK